MGLTIKVATFKEEVEDNFWYKCILKLLKSFETCWEVFHKCLQAKAEHILSENMNA